jgi:hypothetical protein
MIEFCNAETPNMAAKTMDGSMERGSSTPGEGRELRDSLDHA